ncbi:MAG: DNA repair protein RecN [Gemmatimonadota bacterium]
MIVELRVRDLATIQDVSLQLGPGLNVLTGETGAGKSLVVDAVSLLLGARSDSGTVRPGAARAVVEGVFDSPGKELCQRLDELGLTPEDDRIIIRREVSSEGRSRAWINGSPATISSLTALAPALVDLHGQHETQSLLRSEAQRDILDAFAGAESDRQAVATAFAGLAAIEQDEQALIDRRAEVRKRADYLRHVVTEIDSAKLKRGEDETLDAESRRLRHSGALLEQAARLASALEGDESGALRSLRDADRALGNLERIDPAVSAWREMLDAAFTNLTELARVAEEFAGGVNQDPARQEEVERRRDLISRLIQKHGADIDAVLRTRAEAAAELELLDTADTDLRGLAARKKIAADTLASSAARLGERRREASGRLARSVSKLLPPLGLAAGRLEVALAPLALPTADGGETVTFLVRLNAGHEAQPLARTASGGELSRLMLALKVVLAQHDAVPTQIFDEVDQGIGGEVGGRVGHSLARVAERRQVLVITHLPQIAAHADRHLVVSKQSRGGVATSDVAPIHGEDRIGELARMLGDADADTARRHAGALLASARGRSTAGK